MVAAVHYELASEIAHRSVQSHSQCDRPTAVVQGKAQVSIKDWIEHNAWRLWYSNTVNLQSEIMQ